MIINLDKYFIKHLNRWGLICDYQLLTTIYQESRQEKKRDKKEN